jgi:hypothetical protein
MKRNNTLATLLLLLWCPLAGAQQLVGSAGGTSKVANTALSWSVGEVVTGVATHPNHTIIVGFQQPSLLTITSVFADPESTIHVFPNPARDRIFVERPSLSGTLKIRAFDINGKTVEETDFETGNDKLEIVTENWNAGVYILRGYREKKLVFESKVIKL